MTFVAMDPPRASFFALWDENAPGGIGARTASKSEYPERSVVDVDVVLPAKRGTTRTTVAAEKLTISEAIDELAPLPRDATTSPSVAAWASVVRAALSLIARGRLLPWVSPAGYDMWRIDPLEPGDHQLVDALVEALPAVAHATPGGSTGAIADPTFAIRTAFDAIADAFVRTPAARRVGSLRVFADPTPTKVPHLRPWVNDLAATHCASSRLVLRMHPPRGEDVTGPGDVSDENIEIELDPIEPLLLPADAPPVGGDSDWHVVFALQSKSDPSLMVEARDYWMAPTEVMDRLGQQAETTLLAGLLTVSRLVKPWSNLLDDVAPTSAVLGDDDLDHFLEQLDDLEAAGISVRWPSELVAPKVERQLVVSAGAPGSGLATTLDLESVLDVDWEFLLDGVPLTAAELAVLAEAKRSVVSLRGRWVRLDRSTLEKLRAPAPKLTIGTALAAALNDSLGDEPGNADGSRLGFDEHEPVRLRFDGVLEALVDQLGELTGQREANEPDQLHAELRNYQRRGLAWLTDLCKLGLGGCLADDMGLGKTIQILALHAQRRATADGAPTLVVCPTSLMQNWAREAAKFTPDFDVVVFHGPNRSLTNLTANCIVITSYGVVRTDHERLDSVVWDLVVADEAQHAKNPRSRTAKALRQLTSGVRIALTGTPVENNLSELWSIIDWSLPGLLGPLETFRRTVALPIERDGDRKATERLQRLIRPFLLRRTKADEGIAPELPEKIERDVVVPLTDEQVTLYRATTEQILAEIAGSEGIDRRGLILRLLTALKQITNHPAHFLGEDGPLETRSGKLEMLDDLLRAAEASGEGTLIFTQYVAMANLIQSHQHDRGRSIAVLHGGLSVKARQALVDDFQAGELSTLVLSLKAGGTGLNLTAATNVVHYDRWWNPAVEDQATDRAYRIGQTKGVVVHRLITEGTVEDRVADLLRAKRALAASITSGGESWIGELDDDDLAELVELSVN
jgi:superfamily II DNA or RNA helicase